MKENETLGVAAQYEIIVYEVPAIHPNSEKVIRVFTFYIYFPHKIAWKVIFVGFCGNYGKTG